MRIKVLNRIYECENDIKEISSLLQELNLLFEQLDYKISYVLIDGNKIGDHIEECILQNFINIKDIEIYVKINKQTLKNVVSAINQVLNGLINKVERLSANFYKGENQNIWREFQSFIDDMQWLNNAFSYLKEDIFIVQKCRALFNVLSDLQNQLRHLEDALRYKDFILVADILNYEIKQSIDELIREVSALTHLEEKEDYAN
jgi:uncharacterized protein YukE